MGIHRRNVSPVLSPYRRPGNVVLRPRQGARHEIPGHYYARWPGFLLNWTLLRPDQQLEDLRGKRSRDATPGGSNPCPLLPVLY